MTISSEVGVNEKNFVNLRSVYNEAMDKAGLKWVPVFAAEEETAVVAKVRYSQDGDVLLGFCGVQGDNHKCLDKFAVEVGNGIDRYNKIVF